MQHWFRDWFNSPYYHKLYAHRDNREAAEFIDRLIIRLNPASGSKMLDVACGKGRHAVQLASKGFDVTGIDLSEKSIAEARQFESGNLHFYVHDMRVPCRINYFDYAFNFFTSFGYFETLREHNATLSAIASSLSKKGIFVIDYLNAPYAEKHLDPGSDEEREDCLFAIRRSSDETHFIKDITVTDKRINKTFVYREKVAKFTCDELCAMLSARGLEPFGLSGDYSLSGFDEKTSPRLIITARKA